MTKQELIDHLQHLVQCTHYSEDGEIEVIAWCDLEPYAGGGKA